MKNDRRVGLLMTVLLMILVVGASAKDWPRFLGPNCDGISDETGLMKSWPEAGPKLIWRTPLGEGYSAVSIVDGRVFTLYQVDGFQWAVALDAETGKQIWKVQLGKEYMDHPGPRCTPTVEENRVYVLDTLGNLKCLDAASGEEKWGYNIFDKFNAKNQRWGMACSPLIDGEKLILITGQSDGSSVVAVNKMTGEVIWKTLGIMGGYASPIIAKPGGVRQYVLLMGKEALGLATEDRKVLWRIPWETAYDVNAANPVVEGDRVFVTTNYNTGCALLDIDLSRENKVDVVWRNKEMKSHFDTPILYKGHLYGFDGPTSQKFICMELETGKTLWEKTGYSNGSHLMADGLIYLLGSGNLALVRPNPEKFDKISGVEGIMEKRNWTMPVVANGRLYLRDETQIKCFDVKAR